jgi:hypothetical protein
MGTKPGADSAMLADYGLIFYLIKAYRAYNTCLNTFPASDTLFFF